MGAQVPAHRGPGGQGREGFKCSGEECKSWLSGRHDTLSIMPTVCSMEQMMGGQRGGQSGGCSSSRGQRGWWLAQGNRLKMKGNHINKW